MIDYHRLKNWIFADIEETYTERDTMLYALGLGLGADPLDREQLRFVYEKNLKTLPTMAVVRGSPGFFSRNPEFGIDWVKLVHGEQHLTLHRPLPASGTVIGRNRIARLVDKGKDKGALMYTERRISEKSSGDALATLVSVAFCRGDGGFSVNGQPSDEPPAALPPVPDGPAEKVCDIATRPEMALIYRLSGDSNPLHADLEVAKSAGFPRPILHGLATYGVSFRAILKTYLDYDPAPFKSMNVRFSAPVFPGETIRTEMWRAGGRISFRARVLERDTVVLNNGWAEVA